MATGPSAPHTQIGGQHGKGYLVHGATLGRDALAVFVSSLPTTDTEVCGDPQTVLWALKVAIQRTMRGYLKIAQLNDE